MSLFLAVLSIDSLAFFGYGISCLFTEKMKDEFDRFGLSSSQRNVTGIAQLLGALGLALGYFTDLKLSLLAASGLCVLMAMGFAVRLKIKDPLPKTLPSFVFMLLNLLLVYALAERI